MDPKLRRMASSFMALLLLLERGMFSSFSPLSRLLDKVFQYTDLHQDEFVQTLKEWVAIENDSAQPVPRFRQELFRMMAMAEDKLQHLGAGVDSVDLGSQQLPDGQSLPVPPILLAQLGNDPQKPTVCFYGHLDVQSAQQDDGWVTDPYTLTEVDGKLYGRGATDNKGPVLAWINSVSAYRALEQEEILMHLWRYPSLFIHGIEGAFDKPGIKTVIPGWVTGKFSVHLVPHMNVSVVEKQVKQHLEDVFSKRNSSNQMTISMVVGVQPWIANINDTQYLAAKRAIRTGGTT